MFAERKYCMFLNPSANNLRSKKDEKVMRMLFLLPQTFRKRGQTDRNGMLMLNNSGKKKKF